MDKRVFPGETPDYYACLLRLWRDHPGAAWRAALIEPASGERHSFASLAEFFAFVEEQTGTRLRSYWEQDPPPPQSQ